LEEEKRQVLQMRPYRRRLYVLAREAVSSPELCAASLVISIIVFPLAEPTKETEASSGSK
jgi:hypothetical protein